MQRTRFDVQWMCRCALAVLLAATSLTAATAQSSAGRWADADDPVAKQLIELERKWAVLECEPSNVVAEAVAEDFVGTSPDGPIYTKADLVKRHEKRAEASGCKLLSARVRYYGSDIAIIYGSETSVRKDSDGKPIDRGLTWTDTWLKRNGKWQIIAVQDMATPKH
jgi:Domain of unknown function (DUF4440)